MVDYLLAREKRWDEILLYWNSFLRTNPANADAFYERSGTYYHQGNLQKAIADLKKACDLGHRQACARYAEYK